MVGKRDAARIPLQISRGCVVASIQVALTQDVLRDFRQGILERVHDCGARGVILDVSGVEVLDSGDFEALRRTMAMAEVMGAVPVVSGLRPGVVSALVDLDVDVGEIRASRDLDSAYHLVELACAEASQARQNESADEPDFSEPDDESIDAGE